MVWIENIQAEWKICAWRARQSVARWLPSTLEGTAAAQLLTVGHFWKRKAGTAGPSGGGWGGGRRGGYRPQSRQSLVPFCFHVYRLELDKLLSNRWGQTVCSVSVFFTKVGGAASPTVAPPVSFAVWVWQWLDLDFKLSSQSCLNCSSIQDTKCSCGLHFEWQYILAKWREPCLDGCHARSEAEVGNSWLVRCKEGTRWLEEMKKKNNSFCGDSNVEELPLRVTWLLLYSKTVFLK